MNVRKVVLTCLVLGLLAGVSLGYLVWANSTSPVYVIEENSMSIGADYLIGLDGGSSYVRNGSSGEIIYTNTTDVYTFAEARDQANSDGGGRIFVKSGTYDFGGIALGYKPRIAWIGSGSTTKVTNLGSFRLGLSNRLQGFTFNDTAIILYSENVTITDCYFIETAYVKGSGNNTRVFGNYFSSSHSSSYEGALTIQGDTWTVTGNIFEDCTRAISTKGGSSVKHTIISGNVFRGCTTAIMIQTLGDIQASQNIMIENVDITGNTIYGGSTGILVKAEVGTDTENRTIQGLQIVGNHISDVSGNATELYADGNYTVNGLHYVYNTTLVANHFFNSGSYGVAIQTGDVYNTYVFGNYFHNNGAGAISDSGTGTNKTATNMGA